MSYRLMPGTLHFLLGACAGSAMTAALLGASWSPEGYGTNPTVRASDFVEAVDARAPSISLSPGEPSEPTSVAGLRHLGVQLKRLGFGTGDVDAMLLAAVERTVGASFDRIPANEAYWEAPVNEGTSGREAALAANELARQQRTRELLLAVVGDAAADSPAFEGLFRPLNDTLPFLSSAKQILVAEARRHSEARKVDLTGSWYIEEHEGAVFAIDQELEETLGLLLTPEEYTEYLMRESSLARSLRRSMAGFDHSEQEFRDIFEIHRQVKPAQTGGYRVMYTAEEMAILEGRVRDYLGQPRYESYRKYADHTFRRLESIAAYYGKSAGEADAAYSVIAQLRKAHRPVSGAESYGRFNEKVLRRLAPVVGDEMARSIVMNVPMLPRDQAFGLY